MERIAGIILAGGESSRMGGGDKCLRPLAGRPILAHVIEHLHPQVAALALNANGEAGRFAAFGLAVVQDPLPGAGPLGGVLAGMLWAGREKATQLVTVAGDTPFFPSDLVVRLAAAQDNPRRIVLAASGGRPHPTCALWPVSLADDLRSFLSGPGPCSMRAFAGHRHAPAHVEFAIDRGRDPFFNINTPEDLQEAEHLAEAGS